ncbi:MAG: 50S ribosomal protein L4 [Deltaproteobacteria bacterium]|nr:50S ribosomal protein L4 [Candidatus Zymogenaceae bacterium]
MPKVDVYNGKNESISKVDLSPGVFDTEVKEHLYYDVIKMQLANRRKGNASTKTRSEVRGGGKKPYRQKGTGRARAGTIRSPLWRGGGIIFGPKPRDYSYKVTKKVRKTALRSALTQKFKEGKLLIVDDLGIDEIKTRKFVEVMNSLGFSQALVVVSEPDRNLSLSARNVPGVKVLLAVGLNVFDVLRYDTLVIKKDAVDIIEKALS